MLTSLSQFQVQGWEIRLFQITFIRGTDRLLSRPIAVLKKVRYALCSMPYALCLVVPHLSLERLYFNQGVVPNFRWKSWGSASPQF